MHDKVIAQRSLFDQAIDIPKGRTLASGQGRDPHK